MSLIGTWILTIAIHAGGAGGAPELVNRYGLASLEECEAVASAMILGIQRAIRVTPKHSCVQVLPQMAPMR